MFAPHMVLVNWQAMALCDRLREERERLGFSQAGFAEKAGVHRNTQVRYENGRTEPEVGYFEVVRGLGVDVDYVLFDILEGQVDCPFLLSQGLPDKISSAECRQFASGKRSTSSAHAMRHWRACQQCPKNPIRSNQQPTQNLADDIDGALLMETIEGFEGAVQKANVQLLPYKKARIIVMLYRAFRLSGRVDQKMIEDAVGIAE